MSPSLRRLIAKGTPDTFQWLALESKDPQKDKEPVKQGLTIVLSKKYCSTQLFTKEFGK